MSRIIYIGKSDNKTKQIFIETGLLLSSDFISCPFGSTKTRFQNAELFSYTIEQLSCDEDGMKQYSIVVAKKNVTRKNCPHMFSFVTGTGGWDIELYALNIPEECDAITKNLCTFFPEDYVAKIVLPQIIQPRYCVGIVVPVYSRCVCLEQFLKSIKKSKMSDFILLFMDESMTKGVVDNDRINVNQLIKDFDIGNTCGCVVKLFKSKHGNMNDSILRGLDALANICDYVSTIDSDTIQSEKWISTCIETHKKLTDIYPERPIILSGFNTINSGKHQVIEQHDDYVIKKSVGGCHMFFTPKIYFSIVRPTIISYKWDTNIITNLVKYNGVVATTRPSVVDHIGYNTSVDRDNKCISDYDVSVDFVG